MDGDVRLTEQGQDQRICAGGSGELHAVCQRIGRDALEHELPDIRVLTLVALKWKVEQADSNDGGEREDERHYRPRAVRAHQNASARGGVLATPSVPAAFPA